MTGNAIRTYRVDSFAALTLFVKSDFADTLIITLMSIRSLIEQDQIIPICRKLICEINHIENT